ncbi:hypothetical protein JIQ42_04433 [Leishmania sp. Namibia]|uniref:hypothetical protein n=1 Tax=Leishmania sp. Namibia TaxID=2802991 RepID=UPI001B40000E|nr:hypothetical protein JIQ42_04433 [Leishmania sp. Namibia]
MDQLYLAMPIPSSGDDEGTQGGSRLDVSAHSSGVSSRSCSCTHRADESSAVSSDVPGETPEEDGDSFGTSFHAARHGRSLRSGENQEGFTASRSPNELYMFLVQLLRVAEDLHTRLERLVPETAASVETVPLLSQTSPTKDGGCGYHVMSDRARDSRKGTALAAHQGIAKLRRRLRKEVTHVQRAVNGLSAAGCADVPASASSDSPVVPPAIVQAAVACALCNAMPHYEGIVTCLERERDVTGVYVPVSRYVGPPRRMPSDSANGASAVHRPFFGDGMRLEVDVVSSNEHRWIKVKTTTARNLELEAAALDVNGSTPLTDMLLALVERSKRTCLPHRRVAQVAVVLLHRPPPLLEKFFAVHGIVWASLPAGHVLAVPRREVRARPPHAAPTRTAAAWLPPLALSPAVVCLDTTALVTLCSQSCYVDSLPYSVRIERLAPFHVLQEQQRKEVQECRAVAAVLEPALRSHTAWYTGNALEQVMRQALLLPWDGAGAETRPFSAVKERGHGLPATLIVSTELDWLEQLEKAAREPLTDAGNTNTHQGSSAITTVATTPSLAMPLDESSLLLEYSGRVERAAASALCLPQERPNWIMADVTYEEFKWILETIAGPQEVARAARLLRLVSVVDTTFLRDCMFSRDGSEGGHGAPRAGERDTAASLTSSSTEPPPLFTYVECLRLSGKVSLRNKIVFGLADAVNAVMVTSNEQLCYAARDQGVHIEACFHPSRSLTEQKMYRLPRRDGPGKPPAVTL